MIDGRKCDECWFYCNDSQTCVNANVKSLEFIDGKRASGNPVTSAMYLVCLNKCCFASENDTVNSIFYPTKKKNDLNGLRRLIDDALTYNDIDKIDSIYKTIFSA